MPIPKIIEEEFNKRAPFPLFGGGGRPLVLANVGSDSHGTKLPPEDPSAIDDIDYCMVVVPPPEYLFGLKQWEGMQFWAGHYDVVVYSLAKWARLMAKQNPNVICMLWLRDEDYHFDTLGWMRFRKHRDIFSSIQAYESFAGYAAGQMHKMTSYTPEIQAELDTLEAELEAAGWHLNEVMDRRPVPMPKGLTPAEANAKADRLRHLRAKFHTAYMGEKRRTLVKKHGFDTKNASHLIRLLRMAVEFISTGRLRVYRDVDRFDLMKIKRGEVPLEEVKQKAEELFVAAKDMKARSPLPKEPNWDAINDLLQDVYMECYRLEFSLSEEP
jgi:hypothetical protein